VSGFDPSTATPVDAPAASSGFDPNSAVPADAPSAAPETAGRVAGLGGRALLEGVGQLEDTPRNIAHAVDAGAVWLLKRAGVIDKDYQLPNPDDPSSRAYVPSNTQGATTVANAAGFPTPATPGERIGSAVVRALPSAALAPEAPIAGAISAGLGGAASQTVAEAGGSPLQQTLAGLAAGSLPAAGAGVAALTRAATRGGAAGQAAMQARLADAAASNTPLTAGQATGSRFLQTVEGSGSKVWGGGPYRAVADQQTESLGNSVDHIVDSLSQGADTSPTAAGEAINKGVAATRQSMKTAEKAAYDNVDQYVPPATGIDISGTLSKLEGMATPTAGAEATTADMIPARIQQLRNNLAADVAANGGSALPYSAVRALKTALGNAIDWGFSPADPVTNGALKSVYGSLKDDITTGVSAVSPEAQQAVKAADALHAANQTRLDLLNSVVNKAGGPEAVYQAATNGTKQGATKIAGVMGALNADQANVVRATVLNRLGRAPAGMQGATGDTFNASSFLTNWAKLAPEAKTALFGSSGTPNSLRAGLDSLANTMGTIRQSTLFKNPSGTGEAVGHGAGLFALLEGTGAAAMGHPGHLAALGGAIAGNNILARALTNPRTVAWLAQSTKLPVSALPNAVLQLGKIGQSTNDPDARDLAAYAMSHLHDQTNAMFGHLHGQLRSSGTGAVSGQ
jgi:hypothetical protein